MARRSLGVGGGRRVFATIAQPFKAGKTTFANERVPQGTKERIQYDGLRPCRDFRVYVFRNPALKRWAILGRVPQTRTISTPRPAVQ
jgi:hypothetical protein